MENLQILGAKQPTHQPYTLVFDVQPCHRHFRYSAEVALIDGESLTIKAMPVYRSGTSSLTEQTGSVRLEVVKNNPSHSWKLFELVYTNVITSSSDLGRALLCELELALRKAGVLPEHQPLSILFSQDNILRSIAA